MWLFSFVLLLLVVKFVVVVLCVLTWCCFGFVRACFDLFWVFVIFLICLTCCFVWFGFTWFCWLCFDIGCLLVDVLILWFDCFRF